MVDNKVFCVHGGISPRISTLDEIMAIDRVMEIPVDGAMTDLMWSDPEENTQQWCISPRGAGYLFGHDQVEIFNRENSLDLICRAH